MGYKAPAKFECHKCEHYSLPFSLKCKAFPRHIPFVIASGKVSHRKAFPGDHGIQFERRKPASEKEET